MQPLWKTTLRFLKLKTKLLYDPAIPTPGHMSGENHNSKRYMHPDVHCSTVYNSQDTEASSMPIAKGMAKEDVVHIHNGILLSHKKE